MKKLLIALAAIVSVVVYTGCGDGSSRSGGTAKESVDLKKPIAEIKAEAAKMDAAALQKQADAYKEAITKKTSELDAKTKELKDIPLTEILGDKSKKLKADIEAKTKDLSSLKERMQVYLDEVNKKAAQ